MGNRAWLAPETGPECQTHVTGRPSGAYALAISPSGTGCTDWAELTAAWLLDQALPSHASIPRLGMECRPEHMECAENRVGSTSMPFPFLTAVFGIVFALIWVFIGSMIVRDGRFAVRRRPD